MESKRLFRLKKLSSIAILLGVAMFVSCKSDLDTIQALTRIDESPIESAFDVEVVYSQYARVRMILKAPRMNRFGTDKNFIEMPEGIAVEFYDSLMNVISILTANYAINYLSDDLFEARNDVVIINEANEKLNTEQLIWDQKKGIIYSEKFVRITTPDEVLFGDGIEADERFISWEITNPRGTFSVETGAAEKDQGEPLL